MTIQIAHLDTLGFAPGGARLAPMLGVDSMHVLLLSLEKGEAVGPCRMSLTVLYLLLEGCGRLQVGDETAVWEQKMAAIYCHRTQLGESPILRAPLERQQLFLGKEHSWRAAARTEHDPFVCYLEPYAQNY